MGVQGRVRPWLQHLLMLLTLTQRHSPHLLTAEAHEAPPRHRGPKSLHSKVPAQTGGKTCPSHGLCLLRPPGPAPVLAAAPQPPSCCRAGRDEGAIYQGAFSNPAPSLENTGAEPSRAGRPSLPLKPPVPGGLPWPGPVERSVPPARLPAAPARPNAGLRRRPPDTLPDRSLARWDRDGAGSRGRVHAQPCSLLPPSHTGPRSLVSHPYP